MDLMNQLYQHFLDSTGVCTDTRKITKGSLFFALKGGNFNGNKFAKQALDLGAAYVVIDEAEYKLDNRYFLVDDVLETLQQLANYHRKQFNIPFLAITGSNGKTTTKELIRDVLCTRYRVHATDGNFNNHIGVPLTLLSMPTDTELAIVEMGANKIGDIAELCAIAEPTHGIITNIGKAHLEGFGSVEGIKKGKGELFDFLASANGTCFVNTNDPVLLRLSEQVTNRDLYSDVNYQLIEANPSVLFHSKKGKVRTNLMGDYNYMNMLAAIHVGLFFSIPEEKALKAITDYESTNNRSQLIKIGHRTILLDAYNANPTSMEKSIESFSLSEGNQKAVVLGEMLELGLASAEEHKHLLNLLNQFDHVFLFGNEFTPFKKEFPTYAFFTDKEVLKSNLQQLATSVDTVLIKGSRGNRLEELVKVFEA
ncbi:MAG: UDP-N-acetylmuramoyl-tripeptide--D-alanyl-D-alanine ligase [Cyclobacteriaceae bacterium]